MIHIGPSIPPVPGKVAKRIWQGSFIDMAELLPEQLSSPFPDDEPTHSRPKRRTICNITEWVQCFGIYVAIISQKEPNRVTDLLSYQSLIIQAAQQYQGDCWLRYDRRFRQMVEAKPSTSWAVIDTTIWNLAFSGRANPSRCRHCSSFSHLSSECEFTDATQPYPASRRPLFPRSTIPSRSILTGSRSSRPLCFNWNESLTPGCSHPNCTYEHICYWCASNPRVADKRHKAIQCPNRINKS